MATNNILQTGTTSLPVSQGGTGNASATAYAVQCGGTTSTAAYQSIASVGTSGQVLTSNGAGALPTFQTASAGTTVIYVGPITATVAALASGGTVTFYTAGSGTAQYKVIAVFADSSGATNFSGGGGNRQVILTDSTTTFATCPTNTLGNLTTNGYGASYGVSTTTVNPGPAMGTATTAGANLILKYNGGSIDWTTGTLKFNAVLLQTTA